MSQVFGRSCRLFSASALLRSSRELALPIKTALASLTTNDYGLYRNSLFTHRLPELTALQLPLLVALHARLNLPELYSLSTLLQALNMHVKGSTDGLATNFGLNTLGKNLISYYVLEHLLIHYPRLPMTIHNAAVDAYMGDDALAETGRSWGIDVDSSTRVDKHLSNEPDALQYGKLRYMSEDDKLAVPEEGIVKAGSSSDPELLSKAYALAVRAIIGGVYTHVGEESAKEFIYRHLLSRKLPLQDMFQFSQPTRELVRVCDKLGFTDPIEIRLTAETGRLLAHPIYAATAFCGTNALGDGVGSLIMEAKTRAVVKALMSYYLYSPITKDGERVLVPSDANHVFDGIVGSGDVAI